MANWINALPAKITPYRVVMPSENDHPAKLRDPWINPKPPRDPERIDRILNKFRELWLQGTDMRFCQLIHCIVDPRCNCQLFNTEDYEFEGRLDQFVKRLAEEADP